MTYKLLTLPQGGSGQQYVVPHATYFSNILHREIRVEVCDNQMAFNYVDTGEQVPLNETGLLFSEVYRKKPALFFGTKLCELVREDDIESGDEDDNITEPEFVEDGETKQQKFLRLVNSRLPKAVKQMRLVGNLSGAPYECTDEQAGAVIAALQKEVDAIREKFFPSEGDDNIPTIK